MSRNPFAALVQDGPTTIVIALAAILVSAHWWSGNEIGGLVLMTSDDSWQPWRYITAALPHRTALDLLVNVALFGYFGFILERTLGSGRFLVTFAVLAAGSAAAQHAFSWGIPGLSGVVFGMFAALWMAGRRDERFAGAVGVLLTAVMLAIFAFYVLADLAGTFAASNIANGAGLLLGAMLGARIGAPQDSRTRWSALLAGCFALLIAAALFARPHINTTPARTLELTDQAIALAEEGDYASAIDVLRDLTHMEPQQSAHWFNLGKALSDIGRYEEASSAFAQAAELSPQNSAARTQLQWSKAMATNEEALRAYSIDDFARSETLYRQAIAHDNAVAELWYGLGHALAAMNRPADAFDAFAKAVDLEPANEEYQAAANWASAQRLDEQAYERLLEEDYERAILLYRQSLRLDEEAPMRWYNLGYALAQIDRFAEAARALERSLELDPEHEQAAVLLEWILEERHEGT